MPGGFVVATFEDSISSYEANLLKFETRLEELDLGAFDVEKSQKLPNTYSRFGNMPRKLLLPLRDEPNQEQGW